MRRLHGELRLEDLSDDACILYATRLRDVIEREGRWRTAGGEIITSADDWLWRPRELPEDADIEIAFVTAEGMSVSAPWPLIERVSGRSVYRVGHTSRYWPARVAFGDFDIDTIEVPGARLHLALLRGIGQADHDAVRRWLGEAATAVSTLYGRFPLDSAQILVLPASRSGEPVPWAQVLRGGGASAHFFINAVASEAELRSDWTAAHELSHMLMPYIDRDDAWLSEGFASYFQNVLRARAGLLSAAEAWQKLDQGFQRGIDGTVEGRSLREASGSMNRDHAYMRVYWSGAAIALMADVRLRQQSDNRQSLGTALEALGTCCLPGTRTWSAHELFLELDELTGTDVFSDLYARYADARKFPDLRAVYAQLGLVGSADRLRLEPDAPMAGVRDAIMSAPQKLANGKHPQ